METKEKTNLAEARTTPKDRSISVIVMAKDLFALPYPPTARQMDQYTSLVDDNGFGSPFGDSNKNFETIVFMEKEISWSIRVNSPRIDRGYTVALEYVIHKPNLGNPEFFDENPINVGADGIVRGTIAKDPKLPNKDDSYTIHFTISNGREGRDYPLDPKLKISTGG